MNELEQTTYILNRLSNLALASAVSVAVLMLSACDEDMQNATAEELLEDATFSAALTQGDEDELEGAIEGSTDDAADEVIDDADETEPDIMQSCRLRDIRAELVSTYDTDGDGELSDMEREALVDDFGPAPNRRRRRVRHHRLRRLHWIYDADSDRSLSESERAELRTDLETRCENRNAQLLEAFDADTSGELDADEWSEVRDFLADRFDEKRQAVLDEFDTNDDGRINFGDERQALRQHRKERFQERRDELKEMFDTDGDGTLSDDELEALKEALKERVRGEHFQPISV